MDSMEQARKNGSRPSTDRTLDTLRHGHLSLGVDPEPQNFRSLEMFVHYQDDIPQNMVLISRREKRRPSSSGTLDSLGGGNILKIVDSDLEADMFRSLESLLANQEDFPAREEKQKPSSSGTLDPIGNLIRIVEPVVEKEFLMSLQMSPDIQADIARQTNKPSPNPSYGTLDPLGGGNLVRVADPEADEGVFRSNELSVDHQSDIARQDNKPSPKPSSSGTLDPLGGGNFVRATDPEAGEGVFRTNELSVDHQDDAAKEAKKSSPRPSSSGTLDSIGGGHLLRAADTDADEGIFNSVEPLVDNQVRQNMMRLARQDKSTQRSSHALDSLGGGRLTGLVDPSYRGPIYRNHLVDSLDQGGDVLRMLDSMSGSELLSSLDSAEGMAVLSALRKTHTKYPKRMLDSVSGWAFGESKRNFDEIDNVGFTGFAKRSPWYAKQLALAKKNFDEIDRAGFETYNKRDFDEIDRTGFETFDKRDRKE